MKLYVGIDGGASSTRGVLINEKGETLNKKIVDEGTNLKVYEDLACKRTTQLIIDLCSEISIPLKLIPGIAFEKSYNMNPLAQPTSRIVFDEFKL